MKSGTEEKQLVIEVMDECVIPQLKQSRGTRQQDVELRRALTKGMERLADGSGMGQSLSGLVDMLVLWMSEQGASLEVISMCAVATSYPKNAERFAMSGDTVGSVMQELTPAGEP